MGGGGKCKAEGSSDGHSPKRLKIEVANVQIVSFVVQVYGDATSGSQFRSFQGLEEYSQLLKWIAKAMPKGPFTFKTVYHFPLSEEAAQDTGVTVGEEVAGSVWNQDTQNGEVQNFRTVVLEAATPLLEVNL
jgi:hypothetical protein